MNGFIIFSKRVGTPIYSKQFVKDFGLDKDGGVNTMNIAALLYAVKLNADFISSTNENLVSDPTDEVAHEHTKLSISLFTCGSVQLHFFQHPPPYGDIMAVVFVEEDFAKSKLKESVNIGDYIAKELCTKFVSSYPKIMAKASFGISRKFESFGESLNALMKDVLALLLQYVVGELQKQYDTNWIYACYSHELAKLLDFRPKPLASKQENTDVLPIGGSIGIASSTSLKTTTGTSKPPKQGLYKAFVAKISKLFSQSNTSAPKLTAMDCAGNLQLYYQSEKQSAKATITDMKGIGKAMEMFRNAAKIMHMIGDSVDCMEAIMPTISSKYKKSKINTTKLIQGSAKLLLIRYGSLICCFPTIYYQSYQSATTTINSSGSVAILASAREGLGKVELFLDSIAERRSIG